MDNHAVAGLLLVLAAVLFCCGCTGTQAAPAGQEGGSTGIVIGALLPLTGDFSESGQASNAALAVAAEDIGAYFAATGSGTTLHVITEDTATDPAVALEKLKLLEGKGVRLVIGPESSTELAAVRSYADEHGIVLISTMSTAPSLAIPGDNVFRFVPTDARQADALVSYLGSEKTTVLVPVWRNDLWGSELHNLTTAKATAGGIAVSDGISYSPGSADFPAIAAALDREVGEVSALHNRDSTAVYAVTYSEIAPIMAAAAGTKNLSGVRWYGSDSNVLTGSLITPGDAAQFAAKTRFTGPAFGDTTISPRDQAIYNRIQQKLGRQPDGYSQATYDALWLAALAGTQVPRNADAAQLKTTLTGLSSVFGGPFHGPLELDAAGDRSSAHYGFWRLEAGGSVYRWVPVAQYDFWAEGANPVMRPVRA